MRQEDKVFAAMLMSPQTSASALLVGLMDRFGTEMFDWEPDTLRIEIESDWGVSPPANNLDKVWALVTHITTNLFYVSLEAFIHVCNALNGSGADFQTYDPATVPEMCWALVETMLISPPDKGEDFSSEILTYMKTELGDEGFTTVPKLLQPHVGESVVDNGTVEDVLVMDGIEAKSYWDSQMSKRTEIDEYVRARLQQLVDDISVIPLRNADPKGIAELKQRASRALGSQLQRTKRESELAPAVPSL